jgi:SAM-dependent methyltransferase
LLFWLRTVAPGYASGVLVDFGCGNKPYYDFFRSKVQRYIGCDITQNSFEDVEILFQPDSPLPLGDGSADTVLSTQVLEHVSDPVKYLREAGRLLKTGGYIILTCPGAYMLHEEPNDFFRYTRYGLESLLSREGMKIVRIDPAGGAWRVIGQTFLNHQTYRRMMKIPLVSNLLYYAWDISINLICGFLDRVNTNTLETVNYMVIAEKQKNESVPGRK